MISDEKKPTSAADLPTGVIPQFSQEDLKRHALSKESPQPPENLPEMEPDDAITGQFRYPLPARGQRQRQRR